jgi:hypothetical protein
MSLTTFSFHNELIHARNKDAEKLQVLKMSLTTFSFHNELIHARNKDANFDIVIT